MRTNWRAIQFFLVAAAIVVAGGCVRESTEGSTTTYKYELWLPLSVLAGGIAAGVLGWFLKSTSSRFGWGLLIAGPVAAIGFGPSLLLTEGTVSERGLVIKSGIWGMTAADDVPFDGLRAIHITSEVTTGRRGRKKTNYYLVCDRADGSSQKVGINNDVVEAAGARFLFAAANRGIPIVDEILNDE